MAKNERKSRERAKKNRKPPGLLFRRLDFLQSESLTQTKAPAKSI